MKMDVVKKKRERALLKMKIKKETKTVEYEDLCFGDVFEIDGKFFMKANDGKYSNCGYWKAVVLENGRIYDVVDENKKDFNSSMELSIDEKVKEVNGEFVVK